jgi:HPt (histidine-containing phosphotransfer) domain-containing protein
LVIVAAQSTTAFFRLSDNRLLSITGLTHSRISVFTKSADIHNVESGFLLCAQICGAGRACTGTTGPTQREKKNYGHFRYEHAGRGRPCISAAQRHMDTTEITRGHAPGVDLPVDLARFREITGGDANVEREILADFLDAMRADEDELRRAVTAGDAAALRRCAHRIQGASSVIAAMELMAACALIQIIAKNNPQDVSNIELTGFDRALERVNSYVGAVLACAETVA